LQAAAHKSCADIFESERRAVKKFKRPNSFGNLYKRKVEIYGFGTDSKKCFFRNCVADVRFDNFKAICSLVFFLNSRRNQPKVSEFVRENTTFVRAVDRLRPLLEKLLC
jgi:hypothetical protein